MGDDEVGKNPRLADDGGGPDRSDEKPPEPDAKTDPDSPHERDKEALSRVDYNSIRNAMAHAKSITPDMARSLDETMEGVRRWQQSFADSLTAAQLAASRLSDARSSGAPEGNTTFTAREFDERMNGIVAQWDAKFMELRRSFVDLSGQYEVLSREYDTNRNASDTLKRGLETSASQLQASQKQVTELKEQVVLFENKLAGTEHRSIEVVGLLSSIVALVLVSATTANSQSSPVSAYLIIVVAGAGLALFACLLHAFFQPPVPRPFWRYWLPFAVIPALAIAAAGLLLFWSTYIGVPARVP